MPGSKPVTRGIINTGIKYIPQNDTAARAKPDKIFSNVCPDIRLANKRIDKLNTRKTWDTNSINTSRGASAIGAPGGENKLKKCVRFFMIPMMFKPINPARAVQRVTIRWLVTVKL